MIWPFKRQNRGPEQTGIPAELTAAIEAAAVTFRDFGGEDEAPRVLVKVTGLGAFYWEGLKPTAERISRAFPNLPAPTCRKAARLVADAVASRNRGDFRRKPRPRNRWVWGWED